MTNPNNHSKLEELKDKAQCNLDMSLKLIQPEKSWIDDQNSILTLISVIEKQRKALNLYAARKLDSAHQPAIAEYCNLETDKMLEQL